MKIPSARSILSILVILPLSINSAAIPSSAAETTAPLEVALSADGVETNELKVSWKSPASINGEIVAYQIELFTEISESIPVAESLYAIDSLNSDLPIYEARISLLLDGETPLENGVLYRAKVTAVDIFSNRASSTFSTSVAPFGVPDPPDGVTATRTGPGEVSLRWNSPPNNGSPVSLFKVLCTPACGATDPTSTETSMTIRGLNPEKTYSFKVQAANARDWSTSSGASNEVVPFGPVLATQSITITPGDSSIVADWQDISVKGASVTKYVVELFLATNLANAIQTVETATSNYTFNSLINGTSYVLRIVGYVGEVSGLQKFSTTSTPLAAPVVSPPNSVPANPPPATPLQTSNPVSLTPGPPTIGKGARLSSNSTASTIGMTVPAKSKISIIVTRSSRKICSFSGGRLRALAPGVCSVTVTVAPPKPKMVKKTVALNVEKGTVQTVMSGALQAGTSPTQGSKISAKVERVSRKICSISGSKIRAKSSGSCVITFSIQAPKPRPTKQTSAIIVQ